MESNEMNVQEQKWGKVMSEKKTENTMLIAGFLFGNEAEAAQAEKEAQGVAYIKNKTDMDNPEMVMHIYNKMIQQKLFETAVGYAYLKDLQEYLRSIPFIRKEDILPIPVQHPSLVQSIKRKERTKTPPKQKAQTVVTHADYRKKYFAARAIAVILAICVAAMFVITATTNNTTILNYENELINKYEMWEQELDAREAALDARELGLPAENE